MAILPVAVAIVILGAQLKEGERELYLDLGGSASTTSLIKLVNQAVDAGDIELAKEIYKKAESVSASSLVLGASSDLEEKLWPELVWQREWEEIRVLVQEGRSAKILLRGAKIKWEMGEKEEAISLWEKARALDPNDEEIIEIARLLELNS